MGREKCSTVQEAIDSMTTLEELEAFTAQIRATPDGCMAPTKAEWQAITEKRILYIQAEGA